MRKFLWMVAVGGLVLALAAPVMALDFKFGGEYRVRFYSGDNIASSTTVFDHNQNARNVRGAQIRVRPMFTVSDDNGNIQAVWRAEIGDIEFGNGGGAAGVLNGATPTSGSSRVAAGGGGGAGNDGVNVETKWIYIDAAAAQAPLRVRAGLQGWYLPKGMIVDDDVAGVRAYGKSGQLSYEVAWFRLTGGPNTAAVPATGTSGVVVTTNTQDNNYDFYQFKVDAAAAPVFNPGMYFLYALNKAQTVGGAAASETYYFGFTTTGKAGTMSYDFDFIYGSAEGGTAGTLVAGDGSFVKVKGYALDAGIHMPVGPVTLNVVGSYATGDKRDGGDSEAFPTIMPGWAGAGGQWELIGGGGTFDAIDTTQDGPTNLWMLGFNAEFRPAKAWWLRGGYAMIGFATAKGNCSVSAPTSNTCYGPSYAKLVDQNDSTKGKSMFGHEVSFRADYTMWTGFKVQGAAGVLIPTQGVPATEFVLQLLYNF